MKGVKSVLIIVTGKPPGKIYMVRPRRRWEENNRVNLKEIGAKTGNWIDSYELLESPCECCIEPHVS